MSKKRVLIVGAAGLAYDRLYQPALLPMLGEPGLELYGVDVVPWMPGPELKQTWVVPAAWDSAGLDLDLMEIAESQWDLVLIVTPPATHARIARFFLEVTANKPDCVPPVLVVEKPIDSDTDAAEGLVEHWSETRPRPILRILDHFSHGKPAIRSLAVSGLLDGFEVQRIWFASFESGPMADSRSFDDGYLVEHAASHGPAMADRLFDLEGIRFVKDGRWGPLGGRYREGDPSQHSAPSERDTWSLASFELDLAGDPRPVPFHVGVGKGIAFETEQKWLRIDGLDQQQRATQILVQISSGQVEIRREFSRQVSIGPQPDDSYAYILGELMSLDSTRVQQATCSPEKAVDWLRVFQEASEEVASELSGHNLDEVPEAVQAFLDDVLGT